MAIPEQVRDDFRTLLLPAEPIVDVFAFFHRQFAKLIYAITKHNRADIRIRFFPPNQSLMSSPSFIDNLPN